MGCSLRAQAVVKARAEQRRQERAVVEARRQAVVASTPKTVLSRAEAAKYLGLAESTLRTWYAEGRGPQVIKFGCQRQSRVGYLVEELDEWRRDPSSYSKPARPDTCGPFSMPGRRS